LWFISNVTNINLSKTNIMATPSLLLIPDRYKAAKLYSQIPDSGAGDLTFARNSNATRVNSAGLIEKVRTNQILQSQSFDNASWTRQGGANVVILSDNETAPNGSLTADKLYTDVTDSFRGVFQSNFSLNTYQFSVFAKKGGKDFLLFYVIGASGGNTGCWFNLDTGTIGTVGASWSNAKIENFGNGWYRCSATVILNNASNSLFYFASDTDNSFNLTANGTDGIFLWGAQLETGDIATDYIPTTTAAVSVGITADIPRLDYTGGGCPSLLLEPQRTNLITFSEQFDNAAWTKTNATITANDTISPDGTQNADKVSDTIAVSTNHIIRFSQPYTSGVAYTQSAFVKNDSIGFFFIQFRSNAFGAEKGVYFNIANGTINYQDAGIIAKIEDYGNGWYRCQATATATNTVSATLVGIHMGLSADGLTQAYTSTTIKSLYLWGAQLEAGSYVSSYIPTLGSSVTRLADAASKTGISSLIGTEFTIFYDGVETTGGQATRYLVLKGSGGTYANAVFIEGSSSNTLALTVLNNSSLSVFSAISPSLTNGQRMKFAVRCKDNDFAFYVNGSLVAAQASGSVPTTADLYLGYYVDNADNYSLPTTAAIYTSGLSNAELATLTAL
jgi:hypothetical protein